MSYPVSSMVKNFTPPADYSTDHPIGKYQYIFFLLLYFCCFVVVSNSSNYPINIINPYLRWPATINDSIWFLKFMGSFRGGNSIRF